MIITLNCDLKIISHFKGRGINSENIMKSNKLMEKGLDQCQCMKKVCL
jgi:hypothetical protein